MPPFTATSCGKGGPRRLKKYGSMPPSNWSSRTPPGQNIDTTRPPSLTVARRGVPSAVRVRTGKRAWAAACPGGTARSPGSPVGVATGAGVSLVSVTSIPARRRMVSTACRPWGVAAVTARITATTTATTFHLARRRTGRAPSADRAGRDVRRRGFLGERDVRGPGFQRRRRFEAGAYGRRHLVGRGRRHVEGFGQGAQLGLKVIGAHRAPPPSAGPGRGGSWT